MHIYIYLYLYIYLRSAFNKFTDFFVQAFKIVVDNKLPDFFLYGHFY